MKKVLSLLLAALLLMSLAACGGGEEPQQTNEATQTTQTTAEEVIYHAAFIGTWYANAAKEGSFIRISENEQWAMQDAQDNIVIYGRLRVDENGDLNLYDVDGDLTLVLTLESETTLSAQIIKEYDCLEPGVIYSSQIDENAGLMEGDDEFANQEEEDGGVVEDDEVDSVDEL